MKGIMGMGRGLISTEMKGRVERDYGKGGRGLWQCGRGLTLIAINGGRKERDYGKGAWPNLN